MAKAGIELRIETGPLIRLGRDIERLEDALAFLAIPTLPGLMPSHGPLAEVINRSEARGDENRDGQRARWVEREHPAEPGGRSFDLEGLPVPGYDYFIHAPSNRFGRGDVGFIGDRYETLEATFAAALEHISTVCTNRIREAERTIDQSQDALATLSKGVGYA